MLDSRDAKEIGIGQTPANFALPATSISGDSRVGRKSALAIFEVESMTVNDERKLTKEYA